MGNAMLSMNPTLNTDSGIDVGNVLLTAEGIKGARMQNTLYENRIKNMGRDTERETLKYESDILDYAMKSARMTNFEEYPMFRENLVKKGMNPQILPEGFETPEAWTTWRENALSTADERIALNKLRAEDQKFEMSKRMEDGTVKTVTVKSMGDYDKYRTEGFERAKFSGTPVKETPTELAKLMKERDLLPDGDIRRQAYDMAIAKKTTEKGMKIYDPTTGNLIVDTGGGSPDLGGAPKGAQTELFKDVVQHQQEIDNIRQIRNLYEPEFLTYGGRAKGEWANFLNKMDANQRSQFQTRRAAFLSAANKSFIAFRKWATGVAGGEREMAEIKRATFSEDDSPQDFEAKIQLAESMARRLNARIKAALKSGVNNDKAFKQFIAANPLDGIPTMQDRGDQLEKLGYKPNQVMAILADEGYMQAGGGAK